MLRKLKKSVELLSSKSVDVYKRQDRVHADLILVMQNGRIIERGRHEDLLAQGGWYAKTYESQQLEMEGGEAHA